MTTYLSDITEQDWQYDEDGYIICPDCLQSMTPSQSSIRSYHAPDCDLLDKYKDKIKIEE